MGRMLIALTVAAFLAALLYCLYWVVTSIRKRNLRRVQEQQQRDLATFAPAVLNGSPLVDVVTQQGKQLEEVADILRGLRSDELNVFMPDPYAARISTWLQAYDQRRDK